MNILFISDHYPPYIKGGAEVSTSLLVDWLSAHHAVTVACNHLTTSKWKYKGVEVYPLIWLADVGSGSRSILKALAYAFGIVVLPLVSACNILRLTRKVRPDVIQVVPSSYQFIPAILALRYIARLPVVVDCRDYSLVCPTHLGSEKFDDTHSRHHGYRCLRGYKPGNGLLSLFTRPFAVYESLVFNANKSLLRWSLRRKPGLQLVAISEYVRGQLLLSGFASEGVQVLPNIAQTMNAPKGKAISNNPSTFVYAGRIDAEKGVWDAIAASEMVHKKGYKFVLQIAGDGEDVAAVRAYVKKHHSAYISMVGKVTPESVIGLYRNALAAIAPSRWPEPFGRFIQEAAVAGVPVITVRSGGIPEGVQDGVTGLLADTGDIAGLAAAMTTLLVSPALVRKMAPAIKKSLGTYAAATIGAKRLRLYEQLRLAVQGHSVRTFADASKASTK